MDSPGTLRWFIYMAAGRIGARSLRCFAIRSLATDSGRPRNVSSVEFAQDLQRTDVYRGFCMIFQITYYTVRYIITQGAVHRNQHRLRQSATHEPLDNIHILAAERCQVTCLRPKSQGHAQLQQKPYMIIAEICLQCIQSQNCLLYTSPSPRDS